MRLTLEPRDFQEAAAAGLKLFDDKRVSTPNDMLDGVFKLRQLCAMILSGAIAIGDPNAMAGLESTPSHDIDGDSANGHASPD